MNKLNEHKELATLCYIASMRERIEKEQREKYLKRIDYLVAANNELMAALEVCESAAMIGVAVTEKKREVRKKAE